MEFIYNQNRLKFIRLYGSEKFDKLYDKVSNSKALVSLIGQSVNMRLAPNPGDLLASSGSIPYVVMRFNIGIAVMAALIILKIWDERINAFQHLASEYRLTEIAEKVAIKWI